MSTPQTGFNRQAIGTTPARLDGPRPQLRLTGDINPTQLFTPEEFVAYYAPAADAANSVISERGIPYFNVHDDSNAIYDVLGVYPEDVNHFRFADELTPDETIDVINRSIDNNDDIIERTIQDVDEAWAESESESRFYDNIRRDVAEQAREFTDNPALDAPSPVEPFDWSDYDRNLGLNDIRQQQELNQELFGAPTEEYLERTAFSQNPRTLATAPPAEEVNTPNVSNGSEQGVSAYREALAASRPYTELRELGIAEGLSIRQILHDWAQLNRPRPAVSEASTEDLTTSSRGSDVDADATLTYSSLRPEEIDNHIRDIAKKQIDGKPLNEEEGDFLDWLETTSKYTRYKTIKDNIDEHNAIVAKFKAYDKRIANGNTSGMLDESIHPVIHRSSGYYAKYRGNSLHGSIDENGHVDIEGANFFTPEGDPNKLLRETGKDLKKGDIISIADNDGALSRDSNPLFVMNLAKILTDPNSKGFKIIPTRDIGFNGLAASHYKGVALPTEFDPNYDKTSKDRIVRAYTMLRNNYIRKFGVDPFEGVDLNEAIKINGIRGKYPGFVVEKLKLGGCVNRRTLATGGSIHINPANRGKFNATKARTGKTTEELTHSKNPLTRKRAIFAQNAAKWHH